LVPARYHSIFANENELSRQRIRAVAYVEILGVVSDNAGRIRAFGVSGAGWNCDHQTVSRIRKWTAIGEVNRGHSGAVVRYPHQTRGGNGDAPRVHYVRIL